MTGLETIVLFNSVAMIANTIVIYFNSKTIWKVMDQDAKVD